MIMKKLVKEIFGDKIAMSGLKFRPAILLVLCMMGSVPMAQADFGAPFAYYECDKYCHLMCTNTIEVSPSEFHDCILAHLRCSCQSRINARNRIVMIVIGLFSIMGTFAFFACCYRFCTHSGQQSGRRGHPIVASPAVSSGSRGITNAGADVNHTSRGTPQCFIVSLTPQKSLDLPPEYMPPPPYHECVLDMTHQQQQQQQEQQQEKS